MFFSIFEPFLIAVVVFSEEMCADLVVHYCLDSSSCISDRQTDNNRAVIFDVIVDDAGVWNRVLCEFEVK